MNKNSRRTKNAKGFYTALGISAVMIGSACYFAYDEGEKISSEHFAAENTIRQDAAVDNKFSGVPKATVPAATVTIPAVTSTFTVTTAAPSAVTIPVITIPAAQIIPAEQHETLPAAAENEDEPVNASVSKLENVKPPLADISNVINPFSGSELVKNPTTGAWQTHNGCDIAAEVGSEVYAISSGEIESVTADPLWGTVVVINHHNGFITRYCSLAPDVQVQQGDVVSSGDMIGVIAESADIESAEAPHLHIEVQANGLYLDPLYALRTE